MVEKNEIVASVTANPVTVLIDEKVYAEFYKSIKDEVAAFVPDVSTDKGRKEISSLAYKVTRTKTAIDAAGKKLNEDARAKINAVDASRRKIRDELDDLAEVARCPLTIWEKAEADREQLIQEWYDKLRAATALSPGDEGSNMISDRIATVNDMAIDPAVFRHDVEAAEQILNQSLATLETALERSKKHEADQAELARLRQEAEARNAVETEARDLAERAAREAAAEEFRKQAEVDRAAKAEVEAKAREERAAEVARLEAKRLADAEHAAELARVEAKRLKLEQAEAKRLADLETARQEDLIRSADRAHRGEIMSAAKEGLIAIGIGEATAKKIVLAIVAGEIPNVTMRF